MGKEKQVLSVCFSTSSTIHHALITSFDCLFSRMISPRPFSVSSFWLPLSSSMIPILRCVNRIVHDIANAATPQTGMLRFQGKSCFHTLLCLLFSLEWDLCSNSTSPFGKQTIVSFSPHSVFGAPIGRMANGDINAATHLSSIRTAQEKLEKKLL